MTYKWNLGPEPLKKLVRELNMISYEECKECKTDEEIRVQEVFNNHSGHTLFVITCKRCGYFIPHKSDSYRMFKNITDDFIRTWNKYNGKRP